MKLQVIKNGLHSVIWGVSDGLLVMSVAVLQHYYNCLHSQTVGRGMPTQIVKRTVSDI